LNWPKIDRISSTNVSSPTTPRRSRLSTELTSAKETLRQKKQSFRSVKKTTLQVTKLRQPPLVSRLTKK